MKSPFPGLDPYLESFWSNVHTRMMTYVCDEIQRPLPDGLWSNVEESVTIDNYDEGESRRAVPDSHVVDEKPWQPVWKAEEGGVTVADPLVIVDDEPLTERHILIVETRAGNAVVTVIEVLSPANKSGAEKRGEYLRQQRNYLSAGVSPVEIDLIRAGALLFSGPNAKIRTGCCAKKA